MSDEGTDSDRDIEELGNALIWPGPIEEGLVTAHALREIEDHEDRFRRIPQSEMAGSSRADLLSVLLVFGVGAGVLLLFKVLGLI